MLHHVNAPGPRNSLTELARSTASEGAAHNANPAGFASLLRQSQTTAPAPKPVAPPPPAQMSKPVQKTDEPAPHKPEANEAPHESQAPEGSDEASRAKAIQKSRMRATDNAGPVRGRALGKPDNAASEAKQAEATATATDTTAVDAKTGAASPATGTAAADPNLMQWLAGLQRNSAAPSEGKAEGSTDALGAAVGKNAKAKLAADAKEGVEQREKSLAGQTAHEAVAAEGRFATVLAEHRGGARAKDEDTGATSGVKETGAAGAASFAPGPSATREAAAPVAVTVPTPVTSPDFPEALGLQMSVLARDGVHEAELHLNPADMGPVSVQIVMDGTQARVDFGADVAATRHAIEAGLPELASALRDAGFTLAGGGVSEHSRGRSDGGHAGGNDSSGNRREYRRVGDEGVRRVSSAARRAATAGGVDLFV
jgi:flagellar hook-length control protein FliK